ncbi:hypothetical protein LX36DRAFT_655687 [Colletotrichum falcatum]|nr:hypothetical protein LX36DRAFT_655687 [Colletotrichum falcatum]
MARPSSPLPTTTTTKTAPSPPQQTRRTTRSSLARFAYNSGVSSTANTAAAETVHDVILGVTDIEDAVANTRGRKRRRVIKAEDARDAETEDGITNVKIEHVETEATAAAGQAPTSKVRKARKPARVINGTAAVERHTEPPSDWESMYDAVKRMRLQGAARDAAVDTMGCERLFHPDASERDRRYHILTALMLSSQTKDTVNAVAMKRLMTELPPHKPGAPGGLNLENVLAVDPAFLNELIWAVGFHNNKTK